MALSAKSLFLYSFEITDSNKYVDFKAASGGPTLTATLTLGYYSLTGLLAELRSALEIADVNNSYTITADRTVNSGTENRITILSSGTYFSLLFGTGIHNASSPALLLGFTQTDKTGATTYTGTSTAGTALITEKIGYNYLGLDNIRKVFGSVNVSASGVKEAVVFQIQQFVEVEFKHEPKSNVASKWTPFFQWAIQQRPFDFTPEITSPSVYYDVTLERTAYDGNGLGYRMFEQLPEFPNYYSTGLITMRKRAN